MIKRFLLIAISAILVIGNVFGQESKKAEIPTDSEFLTGKLSNGLTYYIRKTNNQPKYADFYIVHNVGSLQEEDNQRGLAHFLEHMAFNGTKNFPGKNLLNSLTKNGVKFGTNVNAFTSQDRTVYHIASVPMVRSSFTDSVILMIHDWSSFISCEPDEVNAERGVIMEEWRRSDDSRTRMMSALTEIEQHGSRFAQRRVIGLPKIIESFDPETLVEYYHKWYRPDLQAIVIVGDIEPKEMLSRVEKIFSDIPSVKNGAERIEYPMPKSDGLYIGKYADPSLKASATRIITRYPVPPKEKLGTIESLKYQMAGELVVNMLLVRGQEKSEQNISLYKNLIPTVGDTYYAWRNLRLVATPKNNNLERAFIGVLMEYEQFRRYGFSTDELNDAKMATKAKYAKEAKKVAKPTNETYVNIAINNFTRQLPLFDINSYFKAIQKAISEITTEYMNEFIAKNCNYDNLTVVFSGSGVAPLSHPSDERIKFVVDSVRKAPVDRFNYVSKLKLKFNENLTEVKLPEPVEVTYPEVSDVAANIWSVDLANGAKVLVVNNKRDDQFIRMRAVKKGGFTTEPDSMIPAVRMLKGNSGSFIAGGMEKNNFIRFQNNNGIGILYDLDHTKDIWKGSFTKESADVFFKTLYMDITTAKIDEKSLKQYKDAFIKKLKDGVDIDRKFKDSCNIIEYETNSLLQRSKIADTCFINVETMQQLFEKHFGGVSGYTFIFEGSGLTYSDIAPYIAKYVANLPAMGKGVKAETATTYDRQFYVKPGKSALRYVSNEVKGTRTTVTIDLFAELKYDKINSIASKFLSNILRDRYLKSIREEKGGSYHVGVSTSFFQKPYEYLVCTIDFETNPKMVDELIDCVWIEIEDIAKKGPTEKEIDNIKKFYYKITEQQYKEYKQAMPIILSLMDGDKYINNLNNSSIDIVDVKSVKKIAKELLKQKCIKTMILIPEQK